MSSPKGIIGVVPIGDLAGPAPQIIAAHISGYFNLEADVLPSLDLPAHALDRQRLQYDAGRIIAFMEAIPLPDYLKFVAVLDVDLFIPIFTHVFGEARQGGKVAVVSVFRLGAASKTSPIAPARVHERTAKIALHELGHLFDLQHCEDPRCLMHFSGGLADLDRLTFDLCRYCRTYFRDALFPPI